MDDLLLGIGGYEPEEGATNTDPTLESFADNIADYYAPPDSKKATDAEAEHSDKDNASHDDPSNDKPGAGGEAEKAARKAQRKAEKKARKEVKLLEKEIRRSEKESSKAPKEKNKKRSSRSNADDEARLNGEEDSSADSPASHSKVAARPMKPKKEPAVSARTAERLKKEALAAVEELRIASMDPKALEEERKAAAKAKEVAAKQAVAALVGGSTGTAKVSSASVGKSTLSMFGNKNAMSTPLLGTPRFGVTSLVGGQAPDLRSALTAASNKGPATLSPTSAMTPTSGFGRVGVYNSGGGGSSALAMATAARARMANMASARQQQQQEKVLGKKNGQALSAPPATPRTATAVQPITVAPQLQIPSTDRNITSNVLSADSNKALLAPPHCAAHTQLPAPATTSSNSSSMLLVVENSVSFASATKGPTAAASAAETIAESLFPMEETPIAETMFVGSQYAFDETQDQEAVMFHQPSDYIFSPNALPPTGESPSVSPPPEASDENSDNVLAPPTATEIPFVGTEETTKTAQTKMRLAVPPPLLPPKILAPTASIIPSNLLAGTTASQLKRSQTFDLRRIAQSQKEQAELLQSQKREAVERIVSSYNYDLASNSQHVASSNAVPLTSSSTTDQASQQLKNKSNIPSTDHSSDSHGDSSRLSDCNDRKGEGSDNTAAMPELDMGSDIIAESEVDELVLVDSSPSKGSAIGSPQSGAKRTSKKAAIEADGNSATKRLARNPLALALEQQRLSSSLNTEIRTDAIAAVFKRNRTDANLTSLFEFSQKKEAAETQKKLNSTTTNSAANRKNVLAGSSLFGNLLSTNSQNNQATTTSPTVPSLVSPLLSLIDRSVSNPTWIGGGGGVSVNTAPNNTISTFSASNTNSQQTMGNTGASQTLHQDEEDEDAHTRAVQRKHELIRLRRHYSSVNSQSVLAGSTFAGLNASQHSQNSLLEAGTYATNSPTTPAIDAHSSATSLPKHTPASFAPPPPLAAATTTTTTNQPSAIGLTSTFATLQNKRASFMSNMDSEDTEQIVQGLKRVNSVNNNQLRPIVFTKEGDR